MFNNNQGSGSNSNNPFAAVTVSSGFGSSSTGIFSAPPATTCSSSVFGGSSPFSGTSSSSSFGGGPVFGTSTTSQNTVFGGTAFGSTSNAPLVSPTVNSSSSFGSSSIMTGSVSTRSTSFGTVGTPTVSTFGGTAAIGGSTFGATAGQSGSTTFSPGAQNQGILGGSRAFGGTGAQSGSTFGGIGAQSVSTFGGTGAQSGSTFGGTGAHSGSTFGGTGAQSGSTFGGTGAQSGSTFGGTGAQSGSTFGGTGAVEKSTFGGAAISLSTNQHGNNTSSLSSVFGGKPEGITTAPSASIFGGPTAQSTSGPSMIGNTSNIASQGIFGGTQSNDTNSETASLFQGGKQENVNESADANVQPGQTTGSLFGAPRNTSSVFGGDQNATGGIFGGNSQHNKFGMKEAGEQDRVPSPANQSDNASTKRTIKRPGRTGVFSKALSGVSDSQAQVPRLSRTVNNETAAQDPEIKKTPIRRRNSVLPEDLETKVAIVCKNVPSKHNNHNVLKKHFSQFGEVTRIYPNPRKQQASVHFADHESAKLARAKGRVLSTKLEPLQIFWSAYTKPGASPGGDGGQRDLTQSRRMGEQQGEVNEELQGMWGTSDIQQGTAKRINRPEDKQTRPRSRSPVPLNRAPSPKPRAPSPAVTRSHVTLNSLAGSVAASAGEKYEVLQKRDELLRESLGLHMKKQTELASAKTLKASCLDMCPEKERYMRQYQRRVHVYEMVPGTDQVDHAKAVKEYSRSSADQDLPLPNELRPPEVLDRTMAYLLNNIADLGEDGKWCDWYDFLWNRTRSIRKEITQLQLCDITAVSLVEKCARFHIYSSERLCEEDMMTFDEKINNENLTKSLQTLKELYADLWAKHGQRCPNEAEFRAYIVLMNLNKGDALREMQTLREEVRESRVLRFVVSVHSALNSNNYIRFFKLVQRADFLSACIMHRYFTQVRTNAFFTMAKAYKNNPLTLLELQRLLCFESTAEAEQFCVHHGLEVREESVVIDKHRLVQPETPFLAGRAHTLIESKQQTCVGEVINGDVLPPNDIIQPTHSFGSDDRFLATSVPTDLLVPESSKSGTPSVRQPAQAQSEPDSKPVAAPTKMAFTNEMVKEVAKELFVDVIKEFSVNMSTTFVKAINVYLDKAGDLCDSVMEDTMTEETRVVAEDCLQDVKNEHKELEARHRAEQARLRSLAAEGVCEEMVTACVEEVVKEIAEDQYRDIQAKLQEESQVRSSEVVSLDLLSEILEEEAETVAIETHETDVIDRLRELEENCQAVQWLMVTRYFNRWKNAFAARVRLQRSMLTFPPAPCLQGVCEQVGELIPESEGVSGQSVHLGKKARLTLLTPGQVLDGQARISQHLALQRYWQRIRRERAWAPLDVAHIVGRQLYRQRGQWEGRQGATRYARGCNLYWKLLVCLPEKLQDGVTTNLCNWLSSKLKSGAVPKSQHPHLSELLALYHSEMEPGCRLYVCVRTVKKVLGIRDRSQLVSNNYLQGAAAVTFVLRQMPTDHHEQEEYLMLESSRLRLLLEEIGKLGTRLPLLILVPFSFDASELVSGLELKRLEQEGLLSDSPLIAWLDKGLEDLSSSKTLMRGLAQLAERQPEVVRPAQQTLREFTEDVLHREFYTLVYQDLARRRRQGLLHQNAGQLVSLYNSIVEHMAEIVSDRELADVAWPVPEFVHSCPDLPPVDWNSPQHLAELGEVVLSLSLPEFGEEEGVRGEEGEETDWQTGVEDVWAYVDAVVESGETTRALLYSDISLLLRECRERFESQCWGRLGSVGCMPLYCNIPWTDIIVACVHHRLASLDTYVQARDLGFDKGADVPVYYISGKLSKFGPPTEWLDAVRDDNKQGKQSLTETLVRSVKRKHSDPTHSHRSPKYRQTESPGLQANESRLNLSANIDLQPESEEVQLSKRLGESVSKAISEERRRSQQFDDYLEKALKAGDSADLGFTETLDISFTPLELQVPMFRRLSAPATTFFSPGLSSKATSRSEDLVVTPKSFFSPGLNRSTDPPRPKSAGASRKYSTDNMSIMEKFDILNNSLSSQKQANKLFEMKLQSFIDMDKF